MAQTQTDYTGTYRGEGSGNLIRVTAEGDRYKFTERRRYHIVTGEHIQEMIDSGTITNTAPPTDGTTFTREDGSTGEWINGLPRTTDDAPADDPTYNYFAGVREPTDYFVHVYDNDNRPLVLNIPMDTLEMAKEYAHAIRPYHGRVVVETRDEDALDAFLARTTDEPQSWNVVN